jgi:hypothetical protein
MHPTERFVRAEMDPHHLPICELYDRAWERYEKFPLEERAVMVRENRTIASTIWSLVTDEAFKYFIPLGVVPRKRHGTWEFPVTKDIVLRFKKTTTKGDTSNFRTRRAAWYDAGLPLPDVPEPIRITAGWVLNGNGTGIDDVLILLRGPARWCYSISTKPAIAYDLFSFEEVDADTGPTIRPRHDKNAEDANDEVARDNK